MKNVSIAIEKAMTVLEEDLDLINLALPKYPQLKLAVT